jgi:putative hemolysin
VNLWLEILVILLLILFNGVLAMMEIAIVSARKVRLRQMAENGHTGAQTALDLAEQPARFLSTVQIGITLVGILAGAFGGATLAESLAAWLGERFPPLQPYSESIAVTLIVVIITYLSLVIGELAPKQIAMARAEQLAADYAPWMDRLARLTAPLVGFLSASSNGLVRLLGGSASDEPAVTEEDITGLIEQGMSDGTFEIEEQSMVEQVFRLGDQRADDLMTPRVAVSYLDVKDSPAKIRQQLLECGYSRLPVVQGNLDQVLGFVRARELLKQSLNEQPLDLHAALQPATFVPESTSAFELLARFRECGTHMLFVLDEYGGTQGIVTPTDILEAIVGDIPETPETFEAEIIAREDGSWLVDGMLPIAELKDFFNLRALPAEEDNLYQTVGGFVMTQLRRVPQTADQFECGGLSFEVMDMDGRRVDKVLVKRNAAQI